jgi:sugar/nucleoside kinase (ribokinase family)
MNMNDPVRSLRRPRIAAIGLASWDRFIEVDRYPAAGSYAIVRGTASLPGGTTSNSAVALARLGAEVALVALIGGDDEGAAMRATLKREGVDTRWLTSVPDTSTDGATVIVSADPPDRTIYWHQGAHLVLGDQLDVAEIFAYDVVILDVDDAPLRRFLVDLPAHTRPTARLFGTLTYLADAGLPDAFEIALRHDVIVGNRHEFCSITGESDLDRAIVEVQSAMPGTNLRAGIATRGPDGSTAFTRAERWDLPAFTVAARDTTGAGDAFAGAIAYAMALHWDWPRALRFANAAAGLATRALGAQTSLPTLAEVAGLLEVDQAKLTH